jgi:hypothetical protein
MPTQAQGILGIKTDGKCGFHHGTRLDPVMQDILQSWAGLLGLRNSTIKDGAVRIDCSDKTRDFLYSRFPRICDISDLSVVRCKTILCSKSRCSSVLTSAHHHDNSVDETNRGNGVL